MPDYSKSVIYTIRSRHNIYVGSTVNFRARKTNHKTLITSENLKIYNMKLYNNIRRNDGEWDMQPHSIFPCNSKIELTIEEERIRQLLNADMNMKSCGTGLDKSEYKKQWYEQNKERINEKRKQYREQNKERLNGKRKQYNEQHKDEIREQRRQKVTCECGCDVLKHNLSRHLKSPKHLKLFES